MNLYDSIKNPIEYNKKLKQLIDFYTESDEPKREIYNKLVSATESRDFDKEKYIKDYETLIVKPTMEALYRNIEKRINLNEDVFGKNSSILKNVFKECSTYEDLEKKIESTFDEKRKKALEKCSWIFGTPKEKFDEYNLTYDQLGWYEDAKEFFTDEEIYSLAPFVELKRRMEQYLQVSEDVMGFHVNSEKKMDLDRNNERNDLKFYINAGDDTCKVVSYFRDKCETRNMNYYFKVVNPHKDDLNRSDKLCIYSELKDIQDYLEILQEIRKENPEFIFEQPPMMVGNFENWIGVATDYSGDEYDCPTSYNEAMSNICLKALDKVCMVKKQGLEKEFYIKSSATSSEEIGNDIHFGTKDKLIQKGIPFEKRKAVRLRAEDYKKYDYIIGMEESNIRNIKNIVGEDKENKIYRLLDFSDNPRDIADPWYTGNFETTYNDIVEGCTNFLLYLNTKKQ